jgi:hypothetical protein
MPEVPTPAERLAELDRIAKERDFTEEEVTEYDRLMKETGTPTDPADQPGEPDVEQKIDPTAVFKSSSSQYGKLAARLLGLGNAGAQIHRQDERVQVTVHLNPVTVVSGSGGTVDEACGEVNLNLDEIL